MDKSDEYRRNAQHCQDMANRTQNGPDKSQWLRLAESWLQMIRPKRPTREQAFEAQQQDKGTRQEKSESSH